jgi:hypothetical protein
MRYCLAAALFALAIGGRTIPAGAAFVTPVSSSIQLNATAGAGDGLFTSSNSQSQGGTINALGVSIGATATFDNASVTTTNGATANWTDSDNGTVSFTNVGWSAQSVTSGSGLASVDGTGWTYQFVAVASGFFALNYDVTTSGTNTFGLNGFNFIWSGPGDGATIAANSSGVLTRNVAAGTTYTVELTENANISGILGTRTAVMDGTFTFHVVPEPSSLVLLGVGGLVPIGYSLCRRKRATT